MGDGAASPRAGSRALRPATLLVPAIAIQWLTTLGLALTVRHNGWLYYQGGDQLWYYISGWVLAHGQIPPALIGSGWPALLAPITTFAGPTLVPALPAIVLFNVLVLAPVALLCIYGIAKQIGGRIFGYWATLLWLAVPFIGIKYTDHLYHQRYTELTLPQAFGLTAMADFPSMVAVLVSVYFALRVIERPDASRRSPRASPPAPRSRSSPSNCALPRRRRSSASSTAAASSAPRYVVAGTRAGAAHARALEVPRPRLRPALPVAKARRGSRPARMQQLVGAQPAAQVRARSTGIT